MLSWIILGILVLLIAVGTPIVYIVWIFQQQKKNRKEVQESIAVSFLDRVTKDEEVVLCKVKDKYKIIPPGGNEKKQATTQVPHGFYLHYGAVKDQPVLDEAGNEVSTYSGSINTKLWWPVGKKPVTQVQVEHTYFNKGDPRPLNPFNSFLPVNTDVAVQVLADENSLQALLQHQKYDFETFLGALAAMPAIAKNVRYMVIGLVIIGLVSIVSVILGIVSMRGG